MTTARSRRRFRATLLALCCLLLAQWSLVTHACPVIKRAGDALAQMQVEAEVMAAGGHGCHDAVATPADESSGGTPLCFKHCADEGSATGSAFSVAAAAAAPPRVIRLAMAPAPVPVHWEQAPARADATAPPLSILYCVSLT